MNTDIYSGCKNLFSDDFWLTTNIYSAYMLLTGLTDMGIFLSPSLQSVSVPGEWTPTWFSLVLHFCVTVVALTTLSQNIPPLDHTVPLALQTDTFIVHMYKPAKHYTHNTTQASWCSTTNVTTKSALHRKTKT